MVNAGAPLLTALLALALSGQVPGGARLAGIALALIAATLLALQPDSADAAAPVSPGEALSR